MSTRAVSTLVLATTVVLAACGSSSGSKSAAESANDEGNVVAVGAAPLPGDATGSVGDAVRIAAEAPGDASAAACTVDRQTLGLAADAYELLNGAAATSQQDLLDAQMILEPSPWFSIDVDGSVVPASGSPCS
jgi:hypothetical protein